MDSMSGFDICLVFTFPPRDSTLPAIQKMRPLLKKLSFNLASVCIDHRLIKITDRTETRCRLLKIYVCFVHALSA